MCSGRLSPDPSPPSRPFGRRTRRPAIAITALLLAAAVGGGESPATRGFTRYVPETLPQCALGDVDGDGRSDLALIQDGFAGTSIAVILSGSTSAARFDADVTDLVEGDVDQDGDLDLITATRRGDVVIWINDGHGHFTRRDAAPVRTLVGDVPLVDASPRDQPAVDSAPVLATRSTRAAVSILVAGLGASGRPGAGGSAAGLLPPLRAPPAIAA